MFAPKAPAKATATPTDSLAHQRPTHGEFLRRGSIEQALMLQRSVGNHTALMLLARQPRSVIGNEHGDATAVADSLTDSGQPLDSRVQALMNARFAHDFSDVRVHVGDSAGAAAEALQARAFTLGSDIVFGDGAYAPSSSAGLHVLAHELAHVVQERSAPGCLASDRPLRVSDPGDPNERDAERAAEDVTAGRSVTLTPADGSASLPMTQSKSRQTSTISRQATGSTGAGRRPSAPANTFAQKSADFVKGQALADHFVNLPTAVPEGQEGPPDDQGGAFWLLNGLNPQDMQEVLRQCGRAVRTLLLAHIAETDGRFDRPRLELALRSSASGERIAGTAGLELMDIIRNARDGPFANVWAFLAGKSRVEIIGEMRTLPRTTLTQLQTRLADAPAADAHMFTEVIADLLGTGTNMQASDTIDLEGLSGLDREMASIYNSRGQLIEENARGLGVATHAAAGIMQVESGGATFNAKTNKTIVRFENHVFWAQWGHNNVAAFNDHFNFDRSRGGRPFTQHRFRASATEQWEDCHQDQLQEWRVLEFAAGLSGPELAYNSASWGAGQIMGFNAHTVGYASAVDMVNAFNLAERPQVTAIFEYIRANHLVGAVVRGDFLAIANGYNGSAQAARYAALITDAARAYQRVTAGKRHVIP